jgi:sugar phosphate isomerase/epimerase
MKTRLMTYLLAIAAAAFSLQSCQQAPKQTAESAADELGVNIGVQTYSFRTMDDQSPLTILEYIKETGIKNVELMGNHAEPYAGAPSSPIDDPAKRRILFKQWRNQELTDEEKVQAEALAIEMAAYREGVTEWRNNVDYGKFEELRKLYNDAGISIYAFKPNTFGKDNTDDDIRYGMRAAKALGASHITLEHPEDDAHTARLARLAEEEGVLVGYHGHEQQTPTLWDTAIAQSDANRMNLDFGHYVAAENENPLNIITDKGDKIVSMHLKDRQRRSNGGGNLMWGTGDTPIKEVLQLIKAEGLKFPVTIELEYEIPEGSDAVQEVKRSFEYVKTSLSEY